MKTKIYLDTSVFGGYFDDEFKEDSEPLFKKIFDGKYLVCFSGILEQELEMAPSWIREFINSIPSEFKLKIESNEEIEELAKKYIDENVISLNHFNDTLHIASATVLQAKALISWNFKHIVNFDRIRGYDAVNIKNGYSPIKIMSPKSFIY